MIAQMKRLLDMRQSREMRLLLAGAGMRVAGAALVVAALWAGFVWATRAL